MFKSLSFQIINIFFNFIIGDITTYLQSICHIFKILIVFFNIFIHPIKCPEKQKHINKDTQCFIKNSIINFFSIWLNFHYTFFLFFRTFFLLFWIFRLLTNIFTWRSRVFKIFKFITCFSFGVSLCFFVT